MEPIVGIDLGTTNSEIAFIIDGNAQILKDNDNGVMPSCVGIDNNGKIIVGIEAKNQAVAAPERTVLSVKRLMGTDEKINLSDSAYRPQEISAFILKALKQRAENILKQSISKAVITVPAYFTDAQRLATREAGEIAGLEVIRIINEPTAAALAYETDHIENETVMIYDLGGGTFDVSIVKTENGVVEVLASTGDNHLGGDDFDNKIVDLLSDYLKQKFNISCSDNKPLLARLKKAAEEAKMAISSVPYATIEEDYIAKKLLKDIHLKYELSRKEFEKLIDDDIAKTMEAVNKALQDAQLLPSAIDKIILVGGSTRIPAISKMLEEKFGKKPQSEIDPDLCVALGAGIQAAREMGLEDSKILLDITPYTFGTSAIGEIDGEFCYDMFVPLIQRNTKLPAFKGEAFSTIVDDQEAVEVKVFQGEQKHAFDNVLIGNYRFEISKAPAGNVILINFSLDLNGILKIQAIEKETGKQINAVIENAMSQFTESELSDSKNKIEQMWQDSTDDDDIIDIDIKEQESKITDLPPDISEIVKKAEKLIDSATPEDQDEIVNLLEDIKDSVQNNNLDQARELVKELEDILFYIE